MEQRKLGVAIHGAGWVARAHAAGWKNNPHVQIVSVTDVDRNRAEGFAAEFGLKCRVGDRFEDVLRDGEVDIVDVTGPSHLHAEHGIAAAEAGKHVFVEKPIALSMAENRALRDAVAKAGVKSIGGFVGRWNPSIANLKSLLAAGTIGELIYAEADYWHPMRPSHHAWNLHSKTKTGGGAMLLAGCHALDALRWLTGDEVVEVTAISNNKRGDFEYDPNVVAVMKFRSGMIAKSSTLFDCEMPYTFNIDLVGIDGALRDNRLWSKKLLPGQTNWAVLPTILLDSGDVAHHAFNAEIDHFVECIRQGASRTATSPTPTAPTSCVLPSTARSKSAASRSRCRWISWSNRLSKTACGAGVSPARCSRDGCTTRRQSQSWTDARMPCRSKIRLAVGSFCGPFPLRRREARYADQQAGGRRSASVTARSSRRNSSATLVRVDSSFVLDEAGRPSCMGSMEATGPSTASITSSKVTSAGLRRRE